LMYLGILEEQQELVYSTNSSIIVLKVLWSVLLFSHRSFYPLPNPRGALPTSRVLQSLSPLGVLPVVCNKALFCLPRSVPNSTSVHTVYIGVYCNTQGQLLLWQLLLLVCWYFRDS
jgi:hypothetical protein